MQSKTIGANLLEW